MDLHTWAKWLIHDSKHSLDNQLQNLEPEDYLIWEYNLDTM